MTNPVITPVRSGQETEEISDASLPSDTHSRRQFLQLALAGAAVASSLVVTGAHAQSEVGRSDADFDKLISAGSQAIIKDLRAADLNTSNFNERLSRILEACGKENRFFGLVGEFARNQEYKFQLVSDKSKLPEAVREEFKRDDGSGALAITDIQNNIVYFDTALISDIKDSRYTDQSFGLRLLAVLANEGVHILWDNRTSEQESKDISASLTADSIREQAKKIRGGDAEIAPVEQLILQKLVAEEIASTIAERWVLGSRVQSLSALTELKQLDPAMFSEKELAQDIMQRSDRGFENLIVKTLRDGKQLIGDTDQLPKELLKLFDPSKEDRDTFLHRLTGAVVKGHLIERYIEQQLQQMRIAPEGFTIKDIDFVKVLAPPK